MALNPPYTLARCKYAIGPLLGTPAPTGDCRNTWSWLLHEKTLLRTEANDRHPLGTATMPSNSRRNAMTLIKA